jgi:hypothetical protein
MWQPNLQDMWFDSFESCVNELYKFKALFLHLELQKNMVVSRSGEMWWILRERELCAGMISDGEKVTRLLAEVTDPPSLLEAALNSVLKHRLPVEELPRTLMKQVSGWTARRMLRDQKREVAMIDLLSTLKQKWEISNTNEWKEAMMETDRRVLILTYDRMIFDVR